MPEIIYRNVLNKSFKWMTIDDFVKHSGFSLDKIMLDMDAGYIPFDKEDRTILIPISHISICAYLKAKGDTSRIKKWTGMWGTRVREYISVNSIFLREFRSSDNKVHVRCYHPDKSFVDFEAPKREKAIKMALEYARDHKEFMVHSRHKKKNYVWSIYIHLTEEEAEFVLAHIGNRRDGSRIREKILHKLEIARSKVEQNKRVKGWNRKNYQGKIQLFEDL